ncbi:hypothetical protein BJ138DRAFT_1182871 [Hygrophoropsis aurantiaca]|uniref:Uncharacterized protein n=1 Tax=Hygrophoropsis aurantiaca TaxID=72124 RepID=A0ACB8A0M9_9AGAM|nr:hypothetical protein BJ138DRAFT_1182871 [Hygrophoropsis aurantiaca]
MVREGSAYSGRPARDRSSASGGGCSAFQNLRELTEAELADTDTQRKAHERAERSTGLESRLNAITISSEPNHGNNDVPFYAAPQSQHVNIGEHGKTKPRPAATIAQLEHARSNQSAYNTTRPQLSTTCSHLDVTRAQLEATQTQLRLANDPPATIHQTGASAVLPDIVLSLQLTVLDLQSKLIQAQSTNTAHERTIAALRSQLSKFQTTHGHVTEQLTEAHLSLAHAVLPHSQEKPQALRFDDSAASSPPVTKPASRRKSSRLNITRPPRNPRYDYIYGYDVSQEWVTKTVLQLRPEIGHSVDPNTLKHMPTWFLRGILKMQTLDPVYGLQSQDISIPEDCVGKEIPVHVLAVCRDKEQSFRSRPSQEQVDKLTKLVGRPPRWWRSFDDRSLATD